MIYSGIKKIIPHFLRSRVRDLDIAYQERLKEIELKNQQISHLENNCQELLKELENIQTEHKLQLDINGREKLQEIELKNQQISHMEENRQELLKEIELKNQQISHMEENRQELLKEIQNVQTQHKLNNLDDFKLPEEEYEELSQSGLFIIGNARSGTSILCDCLNLSTDVFLLGEANLYSQHNVDNFVDFFNSQHIQFKNRRCKGTFIPPSRLPEKGGLAFLSRMHKNYKFVGEKITFGPHGDINNQSRQELFFDFHTTYFYFSKYILIMRNPTEAIWSMLKMFPDRSLNLLFESWLRTIQIQIDVFHALPNSYVIFFETLSNEKIYSLCSLMGIDLHIPEGMLREDNKYSLLSSNEIPNELSQYSDFCLACEEIYQQVRDEFDPETFKLKETAPNYGCARYGFSSSIQKKIEAVLDNLSKFVVT